MINKVICFCLLFFTISNYSQIVINELDCDTPSTDDKEFIELKSSTAFLPLDGYVLVLYNGTGSQVNLSYYVIDLDGFTTDINGIFVIGNQLVSPVPDKLLPESIFQNGPDGVALYLGSSSNFPNNTIATSASLIDAMVYGTNDTDATSLMALLGETVQLNESMNNAPTTQSIQRKVDGTYEVKSPTPGANNDGSGFIYNGISISVGATTYNEGNTFSITFTTQNNVTSNLTFNFNLNNGTFNSSDFTGNTTVFIPAGSNAFTTSITIIDDVFDEGDEFAKIKFETIPAQYNRLNDNIELIIIDNDFYTLPFGTPLAPTYTIVTSTQPAGYYTSLEGLSGTALTQAIQSIIANPNIVRAHTYGDVTDIIKVADQNPLNSNQVWLMYKETPRAKYEFQTSSNNTGKWNREHIYPQSRGGFTNGTSDIADGISIWLPSNANDLLTGHSDAHHIRSEDGPENSLRSNKDYGLTGYNGPVGNLNSWKGDVARALFYMAIRYNGLSLVNGDIPDTTVGQLGDLATLLSWNTLDPRDDFEMNRNNYIYTWQFNRNPFIDHPNLANYIWGTNAGQPWFSTLTNTSFNDIDFKIYPNPVQNYFIVSGLKTTSKIALFNTVGVKVFESEFVGEQRFDINLSAGIYFVKITYEDQSSIKKIIIK